MYFPGSRFVTVYVPSSPVSAVRTSPVPEAALFGPELGLDSIDALELALAVSKRYGFQMRSDSEDNRRSFASLRALSSHVEQHRTA